MEQGLEPRELGLAPKGMGMLQAVEQVLVPAIANDQGLAPRELGLVPKGLQLAPKGQGLVPAIVHDQGLAPRELRLAPKGLGLVLAAEHGQGLGPEGVHDQGLGLEPLLGPEKAEGRERVQANSCLSQALVLAQELLQALLVPHVLGLAPKEQGLEQGYAEMVQEPKLVQLGPGQGLGQGQEALGH